MVVNSILRLIVESIKGGNLMKGAIIGDMVGSVYDEQNIKTKDFDMFNIKNRMTDDSLLTIEITKALLKVYPLSFDEKMIKKIQAILIERFTVICIIRPEIGWGSDFFHWAHTKDELKEPYNSFGNGGAMRVSPVGWAANSIEEVKILSRAVTEITHNHPEGLKGAEAIAMSVYLARIGKTKKEIARYISDNYYPELLKLDYGELVRTYEFTTQAKNSVPQAIYCFLISTNFKDAIKTAVSIGGDSDTIASMCGAIAEAYYTRLKPSKFISKFSYLFIDNDIETLFDRFHQTFN